MVEGEHKDVGKTDQSSTRHITHILSKILRENFKESLLQDLHILVGSATEYRMDNAFVGSDALNIDKQSK